MARRLRAAAPGSAAPARWDRARARAGTPPRPRSNRPSRRSSSPRSSAGSGTSSSASASPSTMRQRARRVPGLGDRRGAVELDHRRARQRCQLGVERDDLRPVDAGLQLQRRDRGLQHVRAGQSSARDRAAPRAISRRSHSARSWSASSTSSPSTTREARRASWQSISASRPPTSGSSGINARRTRPSRIASPASSDTPVVAGVEDQVDDREHRRQPLGQELVAAAR